MLFDDNESKNRDGESDISNKNCSSQKKYPRKSQRRKEEKQDTQDICQFCQGPRVNVLQNIRKKYIDIKPSTYVFTQFS